MTNWVSDEFMRLLGGAVNNLPWLQHAATAKVVDAIIGSTRNRPVAAGPLRRSRSAPLG